MPDQIPLKEGEIRPPQPEMAPMPEIEGMPAPEKPAPKEEAEEIITPVELTAPARPAAPAVPKVQKDPTTVAVEKILEEDLGDLYIKLDPQTKEKVKQEGDVVVGKIRTMVDSFRVKARVVLHLIRDWLRTIPGINKYFLEQEAKIKTDKILDLAEEETKKRQGLV